LYTSPNIIRVIKSGTIRWAGRVTRVGEMKNAYKVWSEYLKETTNSEGLGVDGIIV